MEQDIIINYNCPLKPKFCQIHKVDYNGRLEECPICKRERENTAINQDIIKRQKTMKEETKRKNGKKISERIKENKEWSKQERENALREINQSRTNPKGEK